MSFPLLFTPETPDKSKQEPVLAVVAHLLLHPRPIAGAGVEAEEEFP